jgi:hypothetical protein
MARHSSRVLPKPWIDKKGGYSGGEAGADMRPPAPVPSQTVRPFAPNLPPPREK